VYSEEKNIGTDIQIWETAEMHNTIKCRLQVTDNYCSLSVCIELQLKSWWLLL